MTYLNELPRLRLKIRVPYRSLQTNVLRLQKLQQVSDVLRRASRFAILARRLQLQMAEMKNARADNSKLEKEADKQESLNPGAKIPDIEDEKERTIAKAALSIAELGKQSELDFGASRQTSALISIIGRPQKPWSCQYDCIQSRYRRLGI